MAALSEAAVHGPEIVDLRHLVGRELDPLLLEETIEWGTELDWDFSRSADLVRQFAETRSLPGYAILERGEVAGYGYSVLEEKKGLIGDLYVRPAWRNGNNELRLFRAILDGLTAMPQIARIESQLMLVDPAVGKALQRERFVKVQPRLLMKLDYRRLPRGFSFSDPGHAAANRFRIEPWRDHHQELAAGVIALSYRQHVDSEINDQYRSLAGARRFLYNITQFPGCGVFFKPGSFVAFDRETGCMAGIVLASFVARDAGHVTQLCVMPEARGSGLGYELLRHASGALRSNGASRMSLTVTSGNVDAIRLYRMFGFQDARHFSAYVWDRP